jgi:hypothetical protein
MCVLFRSVKNGFGKYAEVERAMRVYIFIPSAIERVRDRLREFDCQFHSPRQRPGARSDCSNQFTV